MMFEPYCACKSDKATWQRTTLTFPILINHCLTLLVSSDREWPWLGQHCQKPFGEVLPAPAEVVTFHGGIHCAGGVPRIA